MRKIIYKLAAALSLAVPSSAFAGTFQDPVIEVYGGFDAYRDAYKALSLILADPHYRGLLPGVLILSIALAGFVNYTKAVANGGRGSLFGWLWPSIVGAAVYGAFFLPTTDIILQDTVTGRHEVIADVPTGIYYIDKGTNAFTSELIDLITTATANPAVVVDYKRGAGGLGYSLLRKPPILPAEGRMSINDYGLNCLAFELARSDSIINAQSLAATNNLLATLKMAVNPAVYTTTWLDAGGAGMPNQTPVTCKVAYDRIEAFYTRLESTDAAVKAQCKSAGFDAATTVACKNLIGDTLLNVSPALTMSADKYAAWRDMAEGIHHTLTSGPMADVANNVADRHLMADGMGMGAVANSYLPLVRAVVTSTFIVSIPILMIFLCSPFWSKSLSLIIGCYVWSSIWTMIDAGIYTQIMGMAPGWFGDTDITQQGVITALTLPTESAKLLGFYGYARTAGMMFASIITGMLGLMGGHAMQSLVGNFTGALQHAGSAAGAAAYTPDGRAAEVAKMQSLAPLANASRFNASDMLDSAAYRAGAEVDGNIKTISRFGGLNPAIGKTGESNAFNAEGAYGAAETFRQFEQQVRGGRFEAQGIPAGTSREQLIQQARGQMSVVAKNGIIGVNLANGEVASTQETIGSDVQGVPVRITKGLNSGVAYSRARTEAQGRVDTAQKNLAKAQQGLISSSEQFSDTLTNSTGYTKGQQKTIRDAFNMSFSLTDSEMERISKDTGISKTNLTSWAEAVSKSKGAGLSLPYGMLSASTSNTGSDEERGQRQKAENWAKSEGADLIRQYNKQRSKAVEAALNVSSSQGTQDAKAAYKGYQASLQETESATTSLNNALSYSDNVQRSIQTHQNKNGNLEIDYSKEFKLSLAADKEGHELLAGASNGDGKALDTLEKKADAYAQYRMADFYAEIEQANRQFDATSAGIEGDRGKLAAPVAGMDPAKMAEEGKKKVAARMPEPTFNPEQKVSTALNPQDIRDAEKNGPKNTNGKKRKELEKDHVAAAGELDRIQNGGDNPEAKGLHVEYEAVNQVKAYIEGLKGTEGRIPGAAGLPLAGNKNKKPEA